MEPTRLSRVLWLYGFVPNGAPLPGGGLAGLSDEAVELLELDGFAAAVTRLPAEDYSAAAIEPHLSDLHWVAERGVQHERVVAWFVDHAQILPVRLFTLYTSEDALREEATARADVLRTQMQRFAGLREWDLKVAYHAPTVAEHLGDVSSEIAALDTEIANAAPGRAFLLQKKRSDLAKIEVSRAARRVANDLLDALQPSTVDVATTPIPAAEGAELPVVLNAALLVALDRERAVREQVQQRTTELRDLGVVVTFSGPWAPYRFLPTEARNDGNANHADA